MHFLLSFLYTQVSTKLHGIDVVDLTSPRVPVVGVEVIDLTDDPQDEPQDDAAATREFAKFFGVVFLLL